ncbi:hypothetical protein GCK32_013497 [Trichostrongylus colubriformis]|uniref:Uncharacterized protein n=1 Tax=Trichostrongylus colubriformis TaxID=6319 RepID=A0AAN8FL02_TRICO
MVPTTRLQSPTAHPTMTKSAEPQMLLPKGGISLARGHQKQLTAVARTLTPPLAPSDNLKISKPSQRSLFPITQDSEWDRIRAEFLRIKRQHKKLFEMQRKNREPATAAGVKTLMADSIEKSGEVTRSRNHKGENNRGLAGRPASVEAGIVNVDVDRSRHTVDRDAPVRRVQ